MTPWRESASLILAAGNPLKILLLQRGAQGSFATNKVFPGGVVHPVDFSLKWENLLPQAASAQALMPQGAERAACLTNRKNELPREIGFRLTAIRETFEECGILLAKPQSAVLSMKDSLSEWRTKVLADANHFYEMCRIHGIHPDIGALKIWSDWLTPIDIPGKRFDTVFFVAEGDQAVQMELSQAEVTGSEWVTPLEALLSGLSGKSRLAPPQLFEFSRLMAFETAKSLLDFADIRQKFGCTLTFPVRVRCRDGGVALFPGDDAYPMDPDFNGEYPPLTVDKSREEFRHDVQNLRRLEGDARDNLTAIHWTSTLVPRHCDPLVVSPEALAQFMPKRMEK